MKRAHSMHGGLAVRLAAVGLLAVAPARASFAATGPDAEARRSEAQQKKDSPPSKPAKAKKKKTPTPSTSKPSPQSPQGPQSPHAPQSPPAPHDGASPRVPAPPSPGSGPGDHSPGSPAPAPASPSGVAPAGASPQAGPRGAPSSSPGMGPGTPPSPEATPARPRTTPASARPVPGSKPTSLRRSYDQSARTPPSLYDRNDHRYVRPAPHHVRPAPHAGHPPPAPRWYRPYYTRWYVHPYYRYLVATYVVVAFTFEVHPWVVTWAPPPRSGWVWVPGYWAPGGFWVPGHWEPVGPAPSWYPGVTYVYVPGFWQGGIYVEGYWRPSARASWTWVDGYYLADGTYVSGHWVPTTPGPEGYVWEPGLFDGEAWTEGFWRPTFRAGYTWVSSYYDEDGVYHSGYWQPTEERPGQVWVPGWFDGTQWIDGYWVAQGEYDSADPQSWAPPEGWDAGRVEDGAATAEDPAEQPGGEVPLAIPVDAGEGQKDAP